MKDHIIIGVTILKNIPIVYVLTEEPEGWIFRNVEHMSLGYNGHHPTMTSAMSTFEYGNKIVVVNTQLI